ncbi:MAG: ribosome recycling factor [Bacillota bacterium]
MVKDILKETESRMKKTIEVFQHDLAGMRAGRATPALLEKVMVEHWGTSMPVNQLANISVPEPKLLVIQPWDKGALASIERAILKSDLGINPMNDGNVIRLVVPQLTQERRQDLVKQVRRKAEEERVAIRNLRREANDFLKGLEKEKAISEDELHRAQDEIQKKTDDHIKEIDRILAAKEKEIMEV